MASNIQPVAPKNPAFYPELDLPVWKKCAILITEAALRILVPLATCLCLYHLLPLAFSAVLIPMAAVGMTTSIAFLFIGPKADTPISQKPFSPPPPAQAPGVRASGLPPHAPLGIKRRGNNCWLNSLLQFCRRDPLLRSYLQADVILGELEDQRRCRTLLSNFYSSYEQNRAAGLDVVEQDAQPLRAMIHSQNALIEASSATQQDPTEGFAALFGMIPENLKTATFRTTVRYHSYPHPTIKNELSDGMLSVPVLSENPTLEALIQSYDQTQNIDPTNKVAFGDRRYQIDTEERRFVTPPRSLSIQLKRFNYERGPRSPILGGLFRLIGLNWFAELPGRAIKLDGPVQIPDAYTLHTLEGGNANYQLDAFIVHRGLTANSGHYVCYAKEGDDWFLIDDQNVRLVDAQALEAAKASAYFIHYNQI